MRTQPAFRWALVVLLALPTVAWSAALVAGTPWQILAGASVPAAGYALLVWWWQRADERPIGVLLACLVWGAVAATFVSTTLNELARAWVEMLAGSGSARALTGTLVAPVVEEAAKAAGLVLLLALRPAVFVGVRDGIVYGALVGIGFTMAENLTYLAVATLQGGEGGLWRAVYLRGVLAGSNHAVFTAAIGAGIGWWRAVVGERRRLVGLAVGVAAGLVQHLVWNGVVAGVITRALCGAEVAGGACRAVPAAVDLFVVVPAVVGAVLGAGWWSIAHVTRASPRRP